MSVVPELKMLTSVPIGGLAIEVADPLTAMPTLLCRNTKKLTKAKRLLGKEYSTKINIEYNSHRPRMSWRMNDKIKQWGITWRDSTLTNTVVSLGINGNLGSAIMMSHRMTLLALTFVYEETWPYALAALVVVHPIGLGEGEDDYIAFVLNATMYHMELCTGAQENGLQFPNGFANDGEDVINAFKIVEATMEQVNKECVEAASKLNKRACTKTSDAAVGAQEIGDETAATRDTSRKWGVLSLIFSQKMHNEKTCVLSTFYLICCA